MNDGIKYAGSAAAGALLAKSLGMGILGVLGGVSGGLALAAWWIVRPKTTTI